MRVRLKGINRVAARLADGRINTYFYAWKGGPRLRGKPGSPEFIASYNEAVARRIAPPQGVLLAVLQEYQRSQDFLGLAERTRADYIDKIKLIEKKFGDFPLSALTDRRSRGVLLAWRNQLATTSRRQADYAWVVLARVMSRAPNRGLIATNPCEKGGRLYRGSRADKVWIADDKALFLAKAPAHLHLALLLALWTGQRQGDLLRLPWSAYDGTHIRLRQGKTRVRVLIPVGTPLKAALNATQKHGPIILTNAEGKPWTEDGFRSSWRKGCALAGIRGLTFHDLRGTAVTPLALAGCTVAEIAAITGHSLRDVGAILDSHYLHRDPALAESAIHKLKGEQIFPNDRPNGRRCSVVAGGKPKRNQLAGGLGFEPRLAESEFAVLPLDDPPPAWGRRHPPRASDCGRRCGRPDTINARYWVAAAGRGLPVRRACARLRNARRIGTRWPLIAAQRLTRPGWMERCRLPRRWPRTQACDRALPISPRSISAPTIAGC